MNEETGQFFDEIDHIINRLDEMTAQMEDESAIFFRISNILNESKPNTNAIQG